MRGKEGEKGELLKELNSKSESEEEQQRDAEKGALRRLKGSALFVPQSAAPVVSNHMMNESRRSMGKKETRDI